VICLLFAVKDKAIAGLKELDKLSPDPNCCLGDNSKIKLAD